MPAPPSGRHHIAPTFALLAIVAVGAALRLWHLDTESLWLDETFSVALARGPVDVLVDETSRDVHSPFYYLLLRAWFALAGDSPWAARLFSVVASLGAVVAAFALGRRLVDRSTGLAAAALIAVAPFQIEYAQEARMYALVACLSAWSWLSLDSLIGSATGETAVPLPPLITRAWAGYVVTTAALVYSHVTGLFVVLAHALVIGYTGWRAVNGARAVERWITAVVAITALFLPWLGPFVVQFTAVQDGFWVPPATWQSLTDTWVAFGGSPLGAIAFGSCALAGWARLALVDRPRRGANAGLLVAMAALVPVVAPFAASLMGSSIFLPKYAIAASAPLIVLAAAGTTAPPRAWRMPLLIGLVVVSVLGLRAYHDRMPAKDDWRRAVAEVERDAHPGDRVLFYPFFLKFPWEVYGTRGDLDVRPFERHVAVHTATTLATVADREVSGTRRVFLLVMQYDQRRGLIADRLRQQFESVDLRRYGHLDVFIFGR